MSPGTLPKFDEGAQRGAIHFAARAIGALARPPVEHAPAPAWDRCTGSREQLDEVVPRLGRERADVESHRLQL
jgi:hypothetical protein